MMSLLVAPVLVFSTSPTRLPLHGLAPAKARSRPPPMAQNLWLPDRRSNKSLISATPCVCLESCWMGQPGSLATIRLSLTALPFLTLLYLNVGMPYCIITAVRRLPLALSALNSCLVVKILLITSLRIYHGLRPVFLLSPSFGKAKLSRLAHLTRGE